MMESTTAISNSTVETPSKLFKLRIIVAFWLLGMCNNYIYVIMLSAAHDVITKVQKVDGGGNETETTNSTSSFLRDCDQLSTGAILLADILPTFFVKFICPYLPLVVHLRLGVTILTGLTALLLVALAENIVIALVGVCFASFNSGLGEITLLAYSSKFPLIAVAAWSSGTGGAGLAGSFAYAGMTEGGLSPEMALYISIVVPILMAISFWIILKHPSDSLPNTSDSAVPVTLGETRSKEAPLNKGIIEKFISEVSYIPHVLPYMIPLGLVYYFEYLINSGLFELLKFQNTSMAASNQFRWYNAMYQVGVFVSRSSVTWIHIKKIWILAALQACNLVIIAAEAVFGFIPNVWIMFVIIFWEGLLGGAAYVNTFYRLSVEIPEEKRLLAISLASIADSLGIVTAGFSSFPVHDAICNLPYNPIFRWPS